MVSLPLTLPLLLLLLLLAIVHQITENPPEQQCATEFSMMIGGSVSLLSNRVATWAHVDVEHLRWVTNLCGIQLSQSPRAAITEYHKLGYL